MPGLGPIGSASPITPASSSAAPASPAAATSAASAAAPTRSSATPGRMAAAASLGTGAAHQNPSAADVQAAASGIQRTWDGTAQDLYQSILVKLDGGVTDRETEDILDDLNNLSPGQFMAVMDRLRQKPWKNNLNMLHKLMRKGVQDDQKFIAELARLGAEMLGLELYPASARGAGRHAHQHAIADAAEKLLDFFESDADANFGMDLVNGLEHAAGTVVRTVALAGVVIYGLLGGTLPAP